MTLAELLKQKAELDRQIAHHQSEGRAKAIADVRALMAEHGLTAADLDAPVKKRGKSAGDGSRKAVAAKYKDDAGNQWTGRGLKPKWLTAALANGKKLTDFAV
jgi:DNA-binding protein H-NS